MVGREGLHRVETCYRRLRGSLCADTWPIRSIPPSSGCGRSRFWGDTTVCQAKQRTNHSTRSPAPRFEFGRTRSSAAGFVASPRFQRRSVTSNASITRRETQKHPEKQSRSPHQGRLDQADAQQFVFTNTELRGHQFQVHGDSMPGLSPASASREG